MLNSTKPKKLVGQVCVVVRNAITILCIDARPKIISKFIIPCANFVRTQMIDFFFIMTGIGGLIFMYLIDTDKNN